MDTQQSLSQFEKGPGHIIFGLSIPVEITWPDRTAYKDEAGQPVYDHVIFEKGQSRSFIAKIQRFLANPQDHLRINAKFYADDIWAWTPDSASHPMIDRALEAESDGQIGKYSQGRLQIECDHSKKVKIQILTGKTETLDLIMGMLQQVGPTLNQSRFVVYAPKLKGEGSFADILKMYQ